MSDLPRITPGSDEAKEMRLAAFILSAVIGVFVSYWTLYGLHALVELMAPAAAHSAASWILSGLLGIFVGIAFLYKAYMELSNYMDL